MLGGECIKAVAQLHVRTHTACNHNARKSCLFECLQGFFTEHIDRGINECKRDVGFVLLAQFTVRVVGGGTTGLGEYRGFESGKTEIQVTRMQHRATEDVFFWCAEFGKFGYGGTSWIVQAQYFRSFIKGFTCGIVQCFAQ